MDGLGFMVVFMLCLFIVHSLCRFGCWCYCAGACYVCLLVCVCCGWGLVIIVVFLCVGRWSLTVINSVVGFTMFVRL